MQELVYPKFRWFVCLAILVATAAQGVILIWPAPLMEQFAQALNLHLGVVTAGMMVSFALLGSLGAVIGGFCYDRFGIVPTILVSSILVVAGTVMTPLVQHSFSGLILSRGIAGLGAGTISVGIGPIAVVWFPFHQRGPITGLQGMSVSLGVALGFAFAPIAYLSTQSLATTALWLSLFPIASIVLFALVPLGSRPPVLMDSTHNTVARASHEFSRITKLPVFYIGIMTIFCMSWFFNAVNDLTPVYLSAEPPLGMGHGIMNAGSFMGLLQIASMVGSTLSGFILGKVFKGSVRTACGVSFLFMALTVFALKSPAVAGNLKVLPACLFLLGFFEGWIVPNCIAFLAMNFPGHVVGKLVGLWMGLGFTGGTLGVMVGAALLNFTHRYQASLMMVGIVSIIGFVLSCFLKAPALSMEATALLPAEER